MTEAEAKEVEKLKLLVEDLRDMFSNTAERMWQAAIALSDETKTPEQQRHAALGFLIDGYAEARCQCNAPVHEPEVKGQTDEDQA